jgi:uncharacterized membrane protein YccC
MAPSNESLHRRALRLSVGVTLVFALTQLTGWPMSHIAPFMTGVLLQDSGPMPLQRGWFIFRMALISTLCGLVIALFLANYPLIMIAVVCALLFRFYVFIMRTADHMLAVIASVVGVLLMPYLVLIAPEVGAVGGFGILLDFAVALTGAWITWYLLPLSQAPPEDHGHDEPPSEEEAKSMALDLVLVMAPLLTAFLAFGFSSVLVLVFSVIFAAGYDSKAGFETGLKMIIANGVYGGIGMLLIYELCVIAPWMPFMFALVALGVFVFGLNIFKPSPTSPYWTSGLNGFLIMLGGALLADQGFTLGVMADRVWQIVLATAYVSFVLAILAMFRDKFARPVTVEG